MVICVESHRKSRATIPAGGRDDSQTLINILPLLFDSVHCMTGWKSSIRRLREQGGAERQGLQLVANNLWHVHPVSRDGNQAAVSQRHEASSCERQILLWYS